ncbi:MAG TPA: sensor domain-containing diguanylate cyclase [Dehalococcoidia bacterium]|nr:sensor domain-containing diguanylate cyclase [Dehalococcoidia bacterium]
MLDYLAKLSRISARRSPGVDVVLEATETVRQALRAEEAYVIAAGDPHFTRLGDDSNPEQYEIKQRGYWIVWRELAADISVLGAVFAVENRLVTQGVALQPGTAGTHVATILPGYESNSELLVVRGPWPEGLSEEEVAFLEAARPILASLVCAVLDSRRQARQREQLRALAEVARAFSEASTVDNVLEAVCTALADASGFDWVQILVVDEACTWIHDRAVNLARHSSTQTAAMGLRGNKRWLNIARRLNHSRRPILRPDLMEPDPDDTPDVTAYFQRAHLSSQAILPMFFQDKMLGFVVFSSTLRRTFEGPEVDFLTDLVSQAATTIKGLRLYQELEEASRIQHFLARTDGLTGIPNRRYIEEVLRAECARAQRYAEPVAVVMADLDHFKDINDTYGHAAGDDAIKHAAEVARESCRESDFVGRWGGDEFLFILPVTSMDGGLAFAERFRSSLSSSAFVPRGASAVWRITLSAGVAEASLACYPHPDSLFQLADQALYLAKESGRDRVMPARFHAAAA